MASCDNDIIADQPGLAQVESEDSRPASESPAFIAAARIGVHRRVGTRYLYLLFVLVLTAHDWQQIRVLILVVREYEYFTLVLVP